MDLNKTGQLIAELRKEMGMTQQQLAEKLHITGAAVSKWERGLSFPDVSILELLADALHISVTELLKGEKQTDDHISAEDAEENIRDTIHLAMEDLTKSRIPVKVRRFFAPESYKEFISKTLLILGISFFTMGGIVGTIDPESDGWKLFRLGIVMMFIAWLMWIWCITEIRYHKKLMAIGTKMKATVTKVSQYYFSEMPFQETGHPYYIAFEYVIDDHIYIGRSPLIWKVPRLQSRNIVIYVDNRNPKRYYMDLELNLGEDKGY